MSRSPVPLMDAPAANMAAGDFYSGSSAMPPNPTVSTLPRYVPARNPYMNRASSGLVRERSLENVNSGHQQPVTFQQLDPVASTPLGGLPMPGMDRPRPASARMFDYPGLVDAGGAASLRREHPFYSPRTASLERSAAAALHPLLPGQPAYAAANPHPMTGPGMRHQRSLSYELGGDPPPCTRWLWTPAAASAQGILGATAGDVHGWRRAGQPHGSGWQAIPACRRGRPALPAAWQNLRAAAQPAYGEAGSGESHPRDRPDEAGLRVPSRGVAHLQTLQNVLESKDQRIFTLESEINLLENELARLREEGLKTPTSSSSGFEEDANRLIQQLRSNERVLKGKVEYLTQELARRDSECAATQSRLEMSDKQQSDSSHHINVLKEQLKARDHKIQMLGTDLEDMRKRLKEKEVLLDKKNKMVTTLQNEKRVLEVQLSEAKDNLDLKERKVSVLQRKVENLEALLNDKETQLSSTKLRIQDLSNESQQSLEVKSAVQEALAERDRLLERLKAQKDRLEQENELELANHKKIASELKAKIDSLQRELEEKSSNLTELREQISEVRGEKFKLESAMSAKQSEISGLQLEVQMLKDEKQLSGHYQAQSAKVTGAVDQLRMQLKSSEEARIQKDLEVQALEEKVADLEMKLSSLRKAQQTDRKKASHLLEEAASRSWTDSTADAAATAMKIRELEKALKDSVRVTAEREINFEQMQVRMETAQKELAQKEAQVRSLESEVYSTYIPEIDKLRRLNQELTMRLTELHKLVTSTSAYGGVPTSIGSLSDLLHPQQHHHHHQLYSTPTSAAATAAANASLTDGLQELRKLLTERDRQLQQAKDELHSLRMQCDQLEMDKTQLANKLSQQQAAADASLSKDLDNQLNAARLKLQEKDEKIKLLEKEYLQQRDFQSEIDIIKKTNCDLQASLSDKDTQISILNKDLERFKAERASLNRNLHDLQTEIKSKLEKIKDLEYSVQAVRDELTHVKKQLTQSEAENKSMKEELSYKEDRLRQTKTSHSEELTRLRNANLEVTERNSQMKIKMDEAEQEIKNISMDRDKMRTDLDLSKKRLLDAEKYASRLQAELDEKMEKMKTLEMEVYRVQTQEIERLQKLAEDIQTRLTQTQKRLDEREHRIKRLEQENNDLLDEIHTLRKKNYELEAQCDTVRSQQFAHGGGFSSGSGVGGSDHHSYSQIQRLQDDLAELRSRFKTVSEERDRLQRELRNQEQEASRHSASLMGSSQEAARLQQELTRKDSQLDKLQLELQRLQQSSSQSSQAHELRRKLGEVEVKLQEKEKHLVDWNQHWDQHQIDCSSSSNGSWVQSDQRVRLETDMLSLRNQLQAEISKRDKALHDLSAEINKRDRTIEELTRGDVGGRKTDHLMMHGNEFMSKDRSLADLQAELRDKDARLKDVTRELNQCQREIQRLSDDLRDRERQLYELQTEMERRSRGDNRGADRRLQERNRELEEEMSRNRRLLHEREHRIHLLETECFQSQVEEIERLRKELGALASGSGGGYRKEDANTLNEMHGLRSEILGLKRDIQQREDTIMRLQR
uniref:Myosin_tail_1 domain-containing protein n=1 Tax=Macrostomum lignano TaxID=282301 RepID=A0A1I8HI66_9PLAT